MSKSKKSMDPNGKLMFIDHHRPALPDGDYSITVTQSIKASRKVLDKPKNTPAEWIDQEVIKEQSFTSQQRTFAVQGPRFTIGPQLIHAVFPPEGSLGEHSSVLPHISFTRSSLPWERFAFPLDDKLEPKNDPALVSPWMALLVFDQSEFSTKTASADNSKQVKETPFMLGTVSGIKNGTLGPLERKEKDYWEIEPEHPTDKAPDQLLSLKFPHESGQQVGDPVAMIDVDRKLLASILPAMPELSFTAHVRQLLDEHKAPPSEAMATLLANRLPCPGRMSIVHLISLEGFYGPSMLDIWEAAADTSKPFIRLISLKSWRFTCVSEAHSFKGLATGLDRTPSTLRLPDGNFDKALPDIKKGRVGFSHLLRDGHSSASWYHGPLVPGKVTSNGKRPCVHSSDQLLRVDPDKLMVNTAYAAAWELGRLLTIQNQKVAISLFDWKRKHRHEVQRLDAMRALEHLPIEGQEFDQQLPNDVNQWFADLALLKGIPFNYLVPDERMLPQESLRLFWLDPDWVRALHDGAFSIGRVLTQDHLRDSAHASSLLEAPHATVTGLLLRSELVSGWPDLLIDAYDERVEDSDYEHPLRDPDNESGIYKSIAANASIQDALNTGELDILASKFGFPQSLGSDSFIETIVEDKSWLVNIHQNQEAYIIKKVKHEFIVQIENKLPLIRMMRLSPNVLLCLFSGEVKTVDIHQKPEALHFGLNPPARDKDGKPIPTEPYFRDIKKPKGGETDKKIKMKTNLWRNEQHRVLNITELAAQIEQLTIKKSKSDTVKESFTSAQFAFQMALGVQKERFTIADTT